MKDQDLKEQPASRQLGRAYAIICDLEQLERSARSIHEQAYALANELRELAALAAPSPELSADSVSSPTEATMSDTATSLGQNNSNSLELLRLRQVLWAIADDEAVCPATRSEVVRLLIQTLTS